MVKPLNEVVGFVDMLPMHDVHVGKKCYPVATPKAGQDRYGIVFFSEDAVPERRKVLESQVLKLQILGQTQEEVFRLHLSTLKGAPQGSLHEVAPNVLFREDGISLQAFDHQ